MSSFKNFAPMLSNLQRQADGRGTLEGSSIDDFLSIAGYGDGGGGGGGEFKTAQVTLKASDGSYWVYPTYTEDNNMQCIFKLSDGFKETFGTDSTPVTGTLCWIGDSGILEAYVVTDIEGDAIYDEETRQVTVTGDCTITGHLDD